MKHWYQQPHSQIASHIRTVLILEGSSEADPAELPIFTNGMAALYCKTEINKDGTENILQLTLYGKSFPEEFCEAKPGETIIAYFFKPFAMASMFNLDAVRLLKSPVDLALWNAHQTNALKTQLIYATSTAQKIEVLDHLLIQQLQAQQRICDIILYATDQIMCNPGTEILSEMLSKLELNERTFQRIFKKYVGVTPNQYRRICQFQLSFTQLRSKEFNKLTDIAYENGFADQSHFIRSFKEFTQLTPNDYLRFGFNKKDE